MTKEEYVHYSECRQASFTYRKGKRFREWASMSSYVDMKPNDDIVDSLGFLTYEMVSKLTMTAIRIKRDQLEAEGRKGNEPVSLASLKRKREDEENEGITPSMNVIAADGSVSTPKQDEHDNSANEEQTDTSDLDQYGLFSLPSTEQTALQPEHIFEAFRRLQQAPQPMKNFRGSLIRNRISLI
jgi:transcription initiation protein SPT3